MGLPVTHLEEEGVGSIVLPFDDHPGHENAAVAALSQTARPPLHSLEAWRMDVPATLLEKIWVVRGSGVHTPNIGAMCQLCLCIGAKNVVVQSWLQPPGLLLLVRQVHERGHKHDIMEEDEQVLAEKQLEGAALLKRDLVLAHNLHEELPALASPDVALLAAHPPEVVGLKPRLRHHYSCLLVDQVQGLLSPIDGSGQVPNVKGSPPALPSQICDDRLAPLHHRVVRHPPRLRFPVGRRWALDAI
mmetsp:Transcript_73317/g.118285  ORF Transcript_73317/g.118285 Transcript_73317/m.118285 type:complete len:245 (+) Transcript_73317:2093-2827(+)